MKICQRKSHVLNIYFCPPVPFRLQPQNIENSKSRHRLSNENGIMFGKKKLSNGEKLTYYCANVTHFDIMFFCQFPWCILHFTYYIYFFSIHVQFSQVLGKYQLHFLKRSGNIKKKTMHFPLAVTKFYCCKGKKKTMQTRRQIHCEENGIPEFMLLSEYNRHQIRIVYN